MGDMSVPDHIDIVSGVKELGCHLGIADRISTCLNNPDAEIDRILKQIEWLHIQIEGLSGLSEQRRKDPDLYHKIIRDPAVIKEIIDETMKQIYDL
jgi:hypothetical protein